MKSVFDETQSPAAAAETAQGNDVQRPPATASSGQQHLPLPRHTPPQSQQQHSEVSEASNERPPPVIVVSGKQSKQTPTGGTDGEGGKTTIRKKQKQRVLYDKANIAAVCMALVSLIVFGNTLGSGDSNIMLKLNLGSGGDVTSEKLQRYIDQQRIDEAAAAGRPNPVGVYVEPTCVHTAMFRATYGRICLDGLEHEAWFMLMSQSRFNATRGLLATVAFFQTLAMLTVSLVVGRQRVSNAAVDIKRTILRLGGTSSSFAEESKRDGTNSNSSASKGPHDALRRNNSSSTGVDGADWSTQASFRQAQIETLQDRLENLPVVDLRVIGTNAQTLITTVWLILSLMIAIVALFMIEPYGATVTYLKENAVEELRDFWKGFDQEFKPTFAIALLIAIIPVVFAALDIVIFVVGVIPYNVLRWCMKRRQEATKKKGKGEDEEGKTKNYFTGVAAATRSSVNTDSPPRSPTEDLSSSKPRAHRHRFDHVEHLRFQDRIDVFFTEWRCFNRLFLAPRLWAFLSGSDRPFFDFDCCSCQAIEDDQCDEFGAPLCRLPSAEARELSKRLRSGGSSAANHLYHQQGLGVGVDTINGSGQREKKRSNNSSSRETSSGGRVSAVARPAPASSTRMDGGLRPAQVPSAQHPSTAAAAAAAQPQPHLLGHELRQESSVGQSFDVPVTGKGTMRPQDSSSTPSPL